jgi:hypothetical protein
LRSSNSFSRSPSPRECAEVSALASRAAFISLRKQYLSAISALKGACERRASILC